MRLIDDLLNKITMYRLILYVLIFLLFIAGLLGSFGILPFGPASILISTVIFVFFCFTFNKLFSNILKIPTNLESTYITALILSLIVSPIGSVNDIPLLVMTSLFAMASKYFIVANGSHIFNPAAMSVFLASLVLNQQASWWVGGSFMFPFVLSAGYLIVRKTQREDLVAGFLVTAFTVIAFFSAFYGQSISLMLIETQLNTPTVFFAFIMLTEPQTMPSNKLFRITYGAVIGLLYGSGIRIGNLYMSPELSLILGNLFSFIVSPKEKIILRLKEKTRIASDIYDFVFVPSHKPKFSPGQYMEWTLPHHGIDGRGNRRYFTIASSPTEDTIRMGIRFNNPSSSFKKTMLALENEDVLVASQLAGDFTMPKDKNTKLVFIAGGVGITPFRSMVKYLLDLQEDRDIFLIYANKTFDEVVYKDIFDQAEKGNWLKNNLRAL